MGKIIGLPHEVKLSLLKNFLISLTLVSPFVAYILIWLAEDGEKLASVISALIYIVSLAFVWGKYSKMKKL